MDPRGGQSSCSEPLVSASGLIGTLLNGALYVVSDAEDPDEGT